MVRPLKIEYKGAWYHVMNRGTGKKNRFLAVWYITYLLFYSVEQYNFMLLCIKTALYPAIKNIFGNNTKHRDSKYMNNIIEQNHRGIKSRYKVTKGFKNIFCTLIFCTAFEEIRQFFRMKNEARTQRRSIIASRIYGFN